MLTAPSIQSHLYHSSRIFNMGILNSFFTPICHAVCAVHDLHSWANHNVTAKLKNEPKTNTPQPIHDAEEAWKVLFCSDRWHILQSSPKCLLYLSLPDLFIPISPSSIPHSIPHLEPVEGEGVWQRKTQKPEVCLAFIPLNISHSKTNNVSISQQQENHVLHNSKRHTHPKQK